ncbi:MAG: pyridoxal phosphate-dependent aminotransferase [Desulfobacter sp.]|nr:MAG: pyridoxal phosphate-dependent aminotransferase [Desulfobacter sp.]
MANKWNFDEIIDRSGTNSMKWEPGILADRFGKGKSELLPFWVADMDFYCAPVIQDAMEKRMAHGIFGYTIQDPGHNKALIHWYRRRHNWMIKNEWIVNTPGIVPAVHYLVQRFSSPGDKVLIQPPVYYPFASAIRANGRRISENPLKNQDGRYGMDFEDLEEKAKDPRVKLAILCSPHNPVGRVWTREELARFGDICIRNNIMVFADEIHCDLIMPGYRHTSYQSISEDLAMHSVAANAASKTFNLAGLNHSSLVIPDADLRSDMGIYFETLGWHSKGSSSLFGAIAAQAAYEGGEPWLNDLIAYIHENFIFLKKELESELPGIKVFELEATYLPWIDFRALGLPAEKIVGLVEEEACLALDPGHWFGTGGAGFERINIACPRKTLAQAVSRLIDAFRPYAASGA